MGGGGCPIIPHESLYDPFTHENQIPHRGGSQDILYINTHIHIHTEIYVNILLSSKNLVRIFHCNSRYTHLES